MKGKREKRNCGLCNSNEGIVDKKWHQCYFHAEPCFRGMRSRQIQLKSSPGALQADVLKHSTDLAGWREDNSPYADENPEVKKQAMFLTRQAMKQTVTVDSKMEIDSEMILTKQNFKGWKHQWEPDCSDDENSAEFDEIFESQGLQIPH